VLLVIVREPPSVQIAPPPALAASLFGLSRNGDQLSLPTGAIDLTELLPPLVIGRKPFDRLLTGRAFVEMAYNFGLLLRGQRLLQQEPKAVWITAEMSMCHGVIP
jgi:hypothetical protein